MIRRVATLLIVLVLTAQTVIAASWVPVKKYRLDYPVKISGTLLKGKSNMTEPQPVSSKYLEVVAAGAVLIERGSGLFIYLKFVEKPTEGLYFKIVYPNPKDPDNPLINDYEYKDGIEELNLSSPDVIWGLKGYQTYKIKIYVYEYKGAAEPIDVLEQNVRSYVDTQESDVLIFKNILSTIPRR